MEKGWIKLHRQIENWKFYFSEPFTKAQAWIDLVLVANHSYIPVLLTIRGNIIEIKRGQVGWSEEALAKRWKWSRGKVRRYLLLLETIQQIVQQKNPVLSVITIVNYNDFQKNSTTDGTTDGQQTVQQTDTNKNDKNDKNEKNDKEERGDKSPTPAEQMKIFIKSVKERNDSYKQLVDSLCQKTSTSPTIISVELDKFINYWTEKNKSGTKDRWELQPTFEVQRRLATWFSKKDSFKNNSNERKGTIIS